MEAPPSDETSPPESPTGSPKQAKRRSFGSDDPTRIWDDLPKHLKIKKRTAYIRRHSDLMVTSNYRKFTLLMWKNYINTKRQWKTSTVQLTAPAFLVTILVIIVSNRQDSHYEQRIYDPFNIDVMPASTFGQECKSIYLQPDTPAIREFKDHLQNAISRNLEYKFSQDDLDVIPYRSDLCALIEFKEYDPIIVDSNSTSTVIRYDIRFPGVLDSGRSKSSLTSIGKRWDTSFRFPPYLIDGPREITDPYGGHPGYYKHGFLYIQHLIAMELAEIIYVKEKMKRNTVPPIYSADHFKDEFKFWQRIASCIFFNTAIAIGCHIISEVEALDEGLNWHNVFGHNIKDFSLGWVMITMVLVGLLKFLLAQYISKVFPDAGIQSLPWNFMFTSWFWNDQLPPDDSHVPYARNDEKSFEENHPQYFEDDSNTKRRKELSIENVSKYHRKLRALHKLNLICHQGNVTVLLGDQGSGKSTLLQMLNGTMAPSSGTIFLSRKDLYKNPVHGRAFVGYLKGLTNRIEAYEEVERFLQITMLADYRDTRVCDLTKSSQRMLMVATAFCGGSRVVLLDDPTLNLSAAQQRVLWDFTGQEKKHRTILVAMDLVHEVDSVVDRIVLLHYGQMTCKGSPEFLQNNFGGGYHLEIESEQINPKNLVEVLISRRVSGSRLFTIHENTLDFYLPQSQTASFPGLLEELETSQETYGIKSFKINFITLEELHLRLKRKSASLDDVVTADTDNKPRKSKIRRRLTSRTIEEALPETDFKPMSDKAGKLREFRLMFLKNVRYTWRKTGLLLLAVNETYPNA
ncbi:unnamed protein product [Orchesella dallaii]|uniref:ABC transporter domain-containing protein n=1 Tax=Orchesella dallaii TaxID=48710 RepID=A0ABP1RE29_9HEXA